MMIRANSIIGQGPLPRVSNTNVCLGPNEDHALISYGTLCLSYPLGLSIKMFLPI